MIKFFKIALVIVLATLCSCAAPSQFSSDYEMTNERVEVNKGDLSIAIPKDYIVPVDSRLDQFEFWLVNKDLNSVLSLNKINVDHKTIKSIYKNRLSILLKYSKVLRKAQFGADCKIIGNDEYFNFDNFKCASFRVKIKGGITQRVIVFQHKHNYYELVALASDNSQSTKQLTNNLYNAQNTLLSSIK